MLAKKIYKFALQPVSSGYRQEEDSMEITGYGKLELQGEEAFLELELQESGVMEPLCYEVFLLLGNEEEIFLGKIPLASEYPIIWQKQFSPEDFSDQGFYYLDQINCVKVQGIPEEGMAYLLCSKLEEPEMEFILEDSDVEPFLESESEETVSLEKQPSSFIPTLETGKSWELPKPLEESDMQEKSEPIIKIVYS